MSILNNFRLRVIFFLISLTCVFTFTLPSTGYCDEWVLVGTNGNFIFYYNNSNIKINKETKQIEVWLKSVYTDKRRELSEPKHQNINYDLLLELFDYDKMRSKELKIISHYRSGEVKSRDGYMKWVSLWPATGMYNRSLNKILADYKLKK